MAATANLALVSDIHYAGELERQRRDYEAQVVPRPLARLLLRAYRRHIWLRDPFAHNHLLNHFLERTAGADLAVANGDFSVDTGFIGVADHAARASAAECLGRLRAQFPDRFHATIGDHELGKISLVGRAGGLRLASWTECLHTLQLAPCWKVELGAYALVGVTSTLLALPVYEPEALPAEVEAWRELRHEHLSQLESLFRGLQPSQRILLFCHDPSALPFLRRETWLRDRLPQIEHTIIGHLHTPLIYRLARLLSGMPRIAYLGNAVRRMSTALNEARHWQDFKVVLCPSLAGIELRKDGGYYTVEIALDASSPPRFNFHPLFAHWPSS